MRTIKVRRFTLEGSTVLEMLEPDAERVIDEVKQNNGLVVDWKPGRQVTNMSEVDEIAIVQPIVGG